ncbi:Mov34/MPN/PAD-1 family protein [Geobacillus sp. WSUCF-018B]|uniref:Mov34/MPN/PAD-1 family protein n=1 Tax=Geobacillus sp. WSUCF-018B TaxID=2055939 RepID=UPI000C281D65|nr:Mov34/MPN/PAD-1 family protein [Geobacillus sp. WSUCF-018B]PJW18889.1 hypothetical protein CV944_01405 [Geobacillus sp. WSUCF-018B]
MIFLSNNNSKLKISDHALQTMLGYRQIGKKDLEAGGILVGRWILDSNDVVVDDVSTPMPNDIRKRCFFKRNQKEHQQFLLQKWIESNGTQNYLGEWHTHPEPSPTPSPHDRKEWKRIIKEITGVDRLFFIIVGTEKIKVWEVSSLNGKIITATLMERS